MAIASERGAVQNPFIRYAVEAGWTYISPDDALRLRPGPTSPVLFPVLVQQLQNLNPGVVDLRRAVDVASAWEYKVVPEADLLKLGKEDLAAGLNKLGEESWELIGFEKTRFVFKRPR